MFIWICRFASSKRIQSCGYTKSSKNSYNKKPTGHPVVNVETQASRSWGAYIIVCCISLFAIACLYMNFFVG